MFKYYTIFKPNFGFYLFPKFDLKTRYFYIFVLTQNILERESQIINKKND
jgi:hypothetical protein